jgi:hypothetical protein
MTTTTHAHNECERLGCADAHATRDDCLDWQAANRYACANCGARGVPLAPIADEKFCEHCHTALVS